MTVTNLDVADFIKANMDFPRLARLVKALGNQLNDKQLRFLKATIFEQSMEVYSNDSIKYVGEEGCDLIININGVNARVEMKYTEDALYTDVNKTLREKTGNIKLMNSMGTNTHKVLPSTYADYLIFVGRQGAMLFDKATIEPWIDPKGDGITANIPTNLGIILATPNEMNADLQKEIDFIEGFNAFVKTYINSVK
jgi:hypothetical protein